MVQTPRMTTSPTPKSMPVSGSGTIRRKLLGGLLAIALIPLVVLGLVAYLQTQKAITERAANQLAAARSSQAKEVRQQFESWQKEFAVFADSLLAVQALADLRDAVNDMSKDVPDLLSPKAKREPLREFYLETLSKTLAAQNRDAETEVAALLDSLSDTAVELQLQYLAKNPNPVGEKHKLERAAELTKYNEQHSAYHPQLRTWVERCEIRDVILADATTGDVVYSYLKQTDFAANLKHATVAATGLGRAFARAAEQAAGETSFADFEPYTASLNAGVAFLAAPVFDNETKVGVAIWELSIDPIVRVLQDRSGPSMSYAVSVVAPGYVIQDGVLSFDRKGATSLQNDASQRALKGEPVMLTGRSRSGESVLASAESMTLYRDADAGTTVAWTLLAEMNSADIERPLTNLAKTLLIVGAIAALLVALAALALAGRMTRQTDAISRMLAQIGIGNFDARAEVVSDDELGRVATSLNAMCDNTLSLIQTKDERDRIQHAVQKLKEEVAIIASGDLTREAEVTDDVTGGVAESINQMIFQLRTLIGNMHETVTQVTSSADDIRKTAEYMSLGADQQAMQIVGTSSSIQEMAESIQQVSEHTEQSAIVANKARENAVHGTESVRNTIRGMDRIRDQVQDNAKRIKRLGETSQEVGEIVQLIGDIADRTSILALNASIQAAMAGEAGKGFGVVAEEVERLAERANHATKQIDSLIKAMQSETSEAIMAMEICTQEVVEGSKIAAEAGMALDEIDAVSHDLAELLHSINSATRQQARGAESVSKSMSTISTVTQQTTANTKRAAESVGNLAALAEALNDSVSAFKLPKMPPRAVNVFDSPEPHQMNPIGSLILKALK